jgi:hypothetical protein
MEEAHKNGSSDFIKPISCHLYPIRISQIGEYQALNYHQWSICSAACDHGGKLEIRVFEFAGVALKRKFGEAWYQEMVEIGKHL